MDVRTILLVSACSGLCLSSMNLGHRERESGDESNEKGTEAFMPLCVGIVTFIFALSRLHGCVRARACVSSVGFVFVCVSFGGKGGGGRGR